MLPISIGNCGYNVLESYYNISDDIIHNKFDSYIKKKYKKSYKSDVIKENEWKNILNSGAYPHYKYSYEYKSKIRKCIIINNKNANTNMNKLYDNENIIQPVFNSGRSTNWAYGWKNTSNSFLHDLIDQIRLEVERIDTFQGCMLLHSLCGTSGGMTTLLNSCIRDELIGNKHFLFNCMILPFQNMDGPLQYYNSLLTLSTIINSSDSCILINNQMILELLMYFSNSKTTKSKMSKTKQNGVQLYDINKYIGNSLGNIFSGESSLNSALIKPFDMGDFVTTISPISPLKFIEIWSTNGLLKQNPTQTIVKSHSFLRKRFGGQYCFGKQLISRGISTNEVYDINERLEKQWPSVKWNPYNTDCKIYEGASKSASISLILNSDRCLTYFDKLYERCANYLQMKAYLHNYASNGITEEHFHSAMNELLDLSCTYKEFINN